VARKIFEKKNQAGTPVFAEVRDYFGYVLLKGLASAGYHGKRGHDYRTAEDKAYWQRGDFEKMHDVLRWDDRNLFVNMIGRTRYLPGDACSHPEEYDGYGGYYGPYQSVGFFVGSEKTTIVIKQTMGRLDGRFLPVVSRKVEASAVILEFDWKERDKALEAMTAWVLENSSPEIVNKILPPEERKAASEKLQPPAAPAASGVIAERPVPKAPDTPSAPSGPPPAADAASEVIAERPVPNVKDKPIAPNPP
jgi:hypothetical protein